MPPPERLVNPDSGTGSEVGQQVDILLSRGQPWRVEIRGLDAYQIMRPMGIIFVVVGTGTAAWGVAIWIFKIPVTSG